MLTIGSRIRLERIRRGIPQAELARRTGIAQANISKIESGKQDILVSTLFQISSALGVHPSLLFDPDTPRAADFSRARLERLAVAVVGDEDSVGDKDRHLVQLLRQTILPDRRISAKRTALAWADLRRRLAGNVIEALRQRVEDSLQRQADAQEHH